MRSRSLPMVLAPLLATALVLGAAGPALADEPEPAPAPVEETAAAEAPVEAPPVEEAPAEALAEPAPEPAPAPAAAAFAVGDADNGDGTSTYTHVDGETVTYPREIAPGEPFTVSGTGWLAKPDMVEEGEEGSVIGAKLIDGALGQLSRAELLTNPRLGTTVTNATVWGVVWADSAGGWELTLDWPDATTATSDPGWAVGASFTLQLLSGTMYSDQPGVDPSQRPDVSRTVPLTIAVVEATTEPEAVAPAITADPADASVVAGGTAVFTAAASGRPAPTAQWERLVPGGQWEAIPGATGATLSLPAVTTVQSGTLVRVSFANEPGTATSVEATLTVTEPEPVAPSFTTQPSAATVSEGGTASFSVVAAGDPAPAIAWESSSDGGTTWAAIAGASGATLAVPKVSLAQSGTRFRAVATNEAGTARSDAAVLTVESTAPAPPAIATHPASQTIETGERATFTAAATGVPAPTVQWQRSTDGGTTWVDLRGATGTSYTIEAVTAAQDGWRYRAVFANASAPGGVATDAATLAVISRENVRETCGTSYGPGAANTGIPFCFRGPEKVLVGESIVIEGVGGYLASDGATGSVVNFFLDAEFSGDPNTVYSKVLFPNPATGATITDRRTVAIVQANGDGTWRVEIPWPTVDRVSPASDGQGSYTQAELDAKFAPGTTHSFRMLTGSLLNAPPDRQRGGSLYFTVVDSLDDEVGVTEPVYEHFTYESEVEGDAAAAWVQKQVSSGQGIGLSGTGWLVKDGQWGSTVVVRLQDETGAYYRSNADPADPTVWQVIRASETGEFDVRLPMPEGAAGGDFVAVELTTADDGTPLGDMQRHWVSEPLTIDNTAYTPPLGEDATCTAAPGAASYELAPGMAVPAANVGGSIRLTGKDWCNLVGGGSLVAIKIDDGAYSHLPGESAAIFDAAAGEEAGPCPATACVSNRTIWYVIEADEHGSFDVEIPLPGRTDSSPAFGEGAYTLRIMTRTLSADPYYQGTRPDPSRTMKTPEFTVVAEGVPLDDVKPGMPKAAPDPLHATDDLVESARGGVAVEQGATSWTVTVPGAEPGDWVYVNVYQGQTPRFPWEDAWFEVGADGRVALPLAGVALPPGTNRLSVQDRSGGLLGWTTVSVAAPEEPAAVEERPVYRLVSLATPGQPKPGTVPSAPVAALAQLTPATAGGVTAVQADGRLVVTIPGVEGGSWVFLHLYTAAGRVIPVDWVQVGTDHTITVELGALPAGTHKLALVGADGALVGWAAANGPKAAQTTTQDRGETAETTGPGEAIAPIGPGFDWTSTLVLGGLALLVLAGSAAGVIALTGPAGGANASRGGRS